MNMLLSLMMLQRPIDCNALLHGTLHAFGNKNWPQWNCCLLSPVNIETVRHLDCHTHADEVDIKSKHTVTY